MMQKPAHVVIAGAGIIGLSCAVTLRRRGVSVTLFEAGRPMQEASWAAGGMLAVDDPANPPALLPLSRYSRRLYEGFLQEVVSLSGIPVPLRTSQTLQFEEDERSGESGPRLLAEASLNPRDLCVALPSAARACGVTLRENNRVLGVQEEQSGVHVWTECSEVRADAFLNCSGAWASSLTPEVAITPRKGQMLVVREPDGASLTQVLRSPEVYLIPRGDGRIAIGATVEDAGFDKHIDPEALFTMRRLAAKLWPPISEAPIVENWCGLRPVAADCLPLIGCISHGRTGHDRGGHSAHFIASGHYRNGILLTPGTAEAVADLLCGITPQVDLAPFSPARASLSAACDKHFAAAL